MENTSSEMVLNLNPVILSTLTKFINELELVFDYIDKNCIENLRKYIEDLNNDNNKIKDFSQSLCEILKQYEENLSYIMTSKQKLKTVDFKFMDDIILFNDQLNFNIFKDENKNTKRTIIAYLYNLYMSCFISLFGTQTNNDEFTKKISVFIDDLQKSTQQTVSSNNNVKQKIKVNRNNFKGNILNDPNIMGLLGNLGNKNLGGLDNILQSFISNKEIMNIASDLSKDIQTQNIDPMTLLTSIMSGKPNNELQNLVSNVTQKIEQKINNGEIDKNVLETQAKNILNGLKNNNNSSETNTKNK